MGAIYQGAQRCPLCKHKVARHFGRDAQGAPVGAFIDLVGGGYVELALELGVAKDRIDTIVDFPAMQKYGVKFEGGAAAASA